MLTQAEKGQAFRALHERDRAFIIPNPWDIGTARLLGHLGFEALASTSMGFAFSAGQCDTTIGRERMIEHVSALASATDLPVSADLENGYGDSPEIVAETIRLAAVAGVVGCSIEDSSARTDQPIYDRELAVERIRAAAGAARALPFPFTLTGRAENYLHGRPDLKDTISRLQAYQEAGADVPLCSGPCGQGRHCGRGQLCGSPGERRDGTTRRSTESICSVGAWCPARQRRQRSLPRCSRCLSSCRSGDARARYLCFRK